MQPVVSGLLVGGIYGLVSMGLSLIFGVMRILNFAQGDLVMLGMYFTWWIVTATRLDPYAVIVLSAPLLFIVGMIIYRFLIRPIHSADDTPQLLVTLGVSIVFQNVALLVMKADPRFLTVGYSQKYYDVAGILINQAQLISFMIAAACTALVAWLLTRTDVGKGLRATVDDVEMAQMVGIKSRRIYLLSFGLGAALAGIGGTALMVYYPASPTVGSVFLIIAFVSVVLGGMGNVVGAYLAGMIVGVVQQLSATFFSVDLQNVGVFILFIILLLFRPNGLFQRGRTV